METINVKRSFSLGEVLTVAAVGASRFQAPQIFKLPIVIVPQKILVVPLCSIAAVTIQYITILATQPSLQVKKTKMSN